MRYLVTFGYWIAVVLMLAAVLVSFDYSFGHALFLASAMLPGMFCAKFFLPMAMREPKRRVFSVGCVVVGIVIVEWVAMMLACIGMMPESEWSTHFPSLFSNPVFILILLTAFVVPEELLSRYLKRKMPRDNSLSFISDRRKIKLPPSDILYVESCDSEVLLHGVDGAVYRTKTRISQWEQLLDGRFVRIHRAYIVNADLVTDFSATQVALGEWRLEVSRKYKEAVLTRFATDERVVLLSREESAE